MAAKHSPNSCSLDLVACLPKVVLAQALFIHIFLTFLFQVLQFVQACYQMASAGCSFWLNGMLHIFNPPTTFCFLLCLIKADNSYENILSYTIILDLPTRGRAMVNFRKNYVLVVPSFDLGDVRVGMRWLESIWK